MQKYAFRIGRWRAHLADLVEARPDGVPAPVLPVPMIRMP
jgi:hypothetical protein